MKQKSLAASLFSRSPHVSVLFLPRPSRSPLRSSLRTGYALGLAVCLALPTLSCRGSSSNDPESAITLPAPLPLPAEPPAAAYLARPDRVYAAVKPWLPELERSTTAIERMLAPHIDRAALERILGFVDDASPWAVARLPEAEEIVRLPIRKGSENAEGLKATLAAFAPQGDFGARTLPLPPNASPEQKARLIWFDADQNAISIGTSLPALVSGRDLAGHYGKQAVFATAEPPYLQLPIPLPLQRVTVGGSFEDLRVHVQSPPDQDLLAAFPVKTGSLGRWLAHDRISAGLSTRVADHDEMVRQVIVEIKKAVDGLPFLVKGIGSDLAKKANSVLRSWDGRTLAALGPSGHVRLAFGSADAKKASVALWRLLDSVENNLELFRNFSSEVPKVSLRKNKAVKGSEAIYSLSIHRARSFVPPQGRALLDEKGRLRVAISASSDGEAVLVTVGSEAQKELQSWFSELSPPKKNTDDKAVLSGTFALSPEFMRSTSPAEAQKVLLENPSEIRYDFDLLRLEDGQLEGRLRAPALATTTTPVAEKTKRTR